MDDVLVTGAAADGRTLDTPALQQAIDTCAARGGGRVVVPAGTFLSGTLHLRSGVTLHLAQGATLRGSGNLADYYTDPEQTYAPAIIGPVLIFAQNCTDVGITGPGTIDGSGGAFQKKMATPRPVMARFRDCTAVTVQDLVLRDGASWTVHAIGCSQVRLEGLNIHSVLHFTNDGLDIDGCTGVLVRGCIIVTSDDGIAVKATQAGRPCRDVTIRDCRLSSHCQAIRVGPETLADISHVDARDCAITDTGMGGICVQGAHGATVSHLHFADITMDRVSNPISIRLGGWRDSDENARQWFLDDARWAEGRLHDVVFRNIQASVPQRYLEGTPRESHTFKNNERTCITVTGATTTRPARIVLENVDVTFAGGGTREEAERKVPELDRQYPTPFMFGVPPAYGLFARHVDELVLRGVRFRLAAADARPALVCDDLREADLSGLQADASTPGSEKGVGSVRSTE